nr:hypothetical protein [uncultured Duganella sp.]
MYSKITQLRVCGARRPDRDVNNDPGVFGMVELVHVGGYLRMQVCEHGNQLPDSVLLPALWEAKCGGWVGAGMAWQGYQQHQLPEQKGNSVYLQEWRVEIIGERPPADEIKSAFGTYNQQAG